MSKLTSLMDRIAYRFDDEALMTLALTHRSKSSKNYERLEFLGDSILGFTVAEWLYHRFPEMGEGKLSRMRSLVVRKETLAKVARKLELHDCLILGEGELKSGGFNRDSILSDVVEGLIGAIYFDAGMEQAKQFVLTHFAEYLEGLSSESKLKDSKSALQEYLQKLGFKLPEYHVIKIDGEQHDQTFTVKCRVEDLGKEAVSDAKSRRIAEQRAAAKVLKSIYA